MKKVEILGPGCTKCEKLFENAEAAVREAGIECELEKVTDINKIVAAGVMMTPAIVIDGEVKMSGRVVSINDLKEMLLKD